MEMHEIDNKAHDNHYAEEIADLEQREAYLDNIRRTKDPNVQLQHAAHADVDGLLLLIENPFVTDLALEKIDFSHPAVAFALLQHPRCPQHVLEAAVLSPLPEMNALALSHRNLSGVGEQWAKLEEDDPQPDPRYMEVGPTLHDVFFDSSPEAEAVYLNMEPDVDELADEFLYENVASTHRSAPVWMLERVLKKIARRIEILRPIKLANSFNSAEEQLTSSNVYPYILAVFRSLARNPNSSKNILREISDAEDEDVLEALVQNPSTPLPNLKRALGSDDLRILLALAGHPSQHISKLFSTLAGRGSAAVDVRLAGNPWLPEHLLEKYFSTQEEGVRLALVANKALYPQQVTDLVGRFGSGVHPAAGSNPSADDALLRSLATSPDPNTRSAIAGNPRTPSELIVEYFEMDPDVRVRESAARNPALPAKILKNFTSSPYPMYWIAHQAQLPVAVQEEIAKGNDRLAKLLLAGNVHAQQSVLHTLAGNEDRPEILLRLTRNPSTSKDTLDALINSRHNVVSIAAEISNLTA